MSACPLLDHPSWPYVRPFVVVETYDRDGGHAHPRHRFEVRLPHGLWLAAFRHTLLAVECPCCACGVPIRPLRARVGDTGDQGRLYVAVSCELSQRYGCARGRAARLAYDALLEACGPPPFALRA